MIDALDIVLNWYLQTDPAYDSPPPDVVELHQTRRFHCTQAVQLYVTRLYRDHWQWWANEYWHEVQTLRIRLHKERRRRQRQGGTSRESTWLIHTPSWSWSSTGSWPTHQT
jgi:hypothetical protein